MLSDYTLPFESKLIRHWGIGVFGEDGAWTMPDGSVLGSLPDVLRVLQSIPKAWKTTVDEALQSESAKDPDRVAPWIDLIDDARAPFIHSLLGYITFFFMAEHGYHKIYSDLNTLNRQLELRFEHGKPPCRTPYIRKLWTIRNHSVAHWADRQRRDSLDSSAGKGWGLFLPGNGNGDFELDRLGFGITGVSRINSETGTVKRSSDRQTLPLAETHEHCVEYLQPFDVVCAEYLEQIKSALPISKKGREYTDGGIKSDHWLRP